MANVSGLTEKMKAFAREYYNNGGNGTEAYLIAYNTDSRTTAQRESSLLLKRADINEYIKALNLPNENKAISEREKKRQWLWDMIENTTVSESDRLRAMDLLNKMDSEYANINVNHNENTVDLKNIDLTALKNLAE